MLCYESPKFELLKTLTVVNGEIIFGEGKDTLTVGKNSTLQVNDLNAAADLEVFNASSGSTVLVTNGKDKDIDLANVTGSWNKAVLIDGEGTLDEGNNDGSVYGNEFDCYVIELEAGKTLTFENLSEGTEIKYSYLVDGEWSEVADYAGSLNAGNAAEYRIFVGVDSEQFNKKDEKLTYSFDAKLA